MAEQTLHGSCLCRSVRYEVSTPFTRFGHCYCSRCRKATGGVRSTNIAVPDRPVSLDPGGRAGQALRSAGGEKFRAADLRQLQLPGPPRLAGRPTNDCTSRHPR